MTSAKIRLLIVTATGLLYITADVHLHFHILIYYISSVPIYFQQIIIVIIN